MRSMRHVMVAFGWAFLAGPALADSGVSIVIPSRADVPIMINGIDASFAVVEGDWGLARSIHVQPTVYGGRLIDPTRRVGGYFPTAGRAPGNGRLEIEPPPRRRRSTNFSRSWTAQSAPPQPAQVAPQMMLDAQVGGQLDGGGPPQRRRRY